MSLQKKAIERLNVAIDVWTNQSAIGNSIAIESLFVFHHLNVRWLHEPKLFKFSSCVGGFWGHMPLIGFRMGYMESF